MKKFIFSIAAMLMLAVTSVNAQEQYNYAGSSKFTDNWSVTLQGGALTTFNDFCSGHTAVAPIAVVGVDKYINPWFGLGVDGRTLIGTGHGKFNSHTAFDAVNVNGYLKFNLANMFAFDGTRHFFEPVVYTGLGWGHQTCSETDPRNYMTYRAGAEFNFNLGKTRAWAIVVNPSVVWGDIDNGKLNKTHGNFELTAGVVYHFKTSNGTHAFTKAKLYDQHEVDVLNGKVNSLQSALDEANATIKMLSSQKTAANTDTVVYKVFPKVQFEKGSSKISSTSLANLADIADAIKDADGKVTVTGYASVEGTDAINNKLSHARAEAVKNALVKLGVSADKIDTVAAGATNQFSPDDLELNRITTVVK